MPFSVTKSYSKTFPGILGNYTFVSRFPGNISPGNTATLFSTCVPRHLACLRELSILSIVTINVTTETIDLDSSNIYYLLVQYILANPNSLLRKVFVQISEILVIHNFICNTHSSNNPNNDWYASKKLGLKRIFEM